MQSLEQRVPIAIDVFMERRKSRERVGTLSQTAAKNKLKFEFVYAQPYILKRNAVPVGPELPLTKQKYQSDELFPTFQDRIPSRENPAFEEYCQSKGISPDETNPLVLLATIARRGPSSFVFEPVFSDDFGRNDIMRYRNELGLTVREFAAVFDIAPSTLHLIEVGKLSGKETLKRLEIYIRFPKVALWELEKHGKKIHESKRERIEQLLKGRASRNAGARKA